ncbi:inner ear-specific collagen [Nothobranchius furzeri]|uniref:Otolin-1-like n=2 Tax=Nothobranchius furzeri TaxID=105023 RepID=A0A1A8VIN1_NOTFU|nr:otolin-1-like [Nothobranchius furzeri]
MGRKPSSSSTMRTSLPVLTLLSVGRPDETVAESCIVEGDAYKSIKAACILLIFLKILLLKMLDASERMVLSSLLGLLVLSSTCSGMHLQEETKRVEKRSAPGFPQWSEHAEGSASFPGYDFLGNMSSNRMFDPTSQLALPTDSTSFPVSNTAICDMLFNAPVPPSIDQIPFFCICSYCKGTGGPKGDRGDRGPPGQPGSPGIRGLTGDKGYRGFTGLQGIKGQKGDYGEKGQPGLAGFTGTKGDQGLKGEKGDLGLAGPPGAQGPQGEMGVCPAICQSIPGAPGTQGPPGPVGARGLPGVTGSVGPKGGQGDKGDTGLPGSPGLNGTKGDQGAQGICRCTNGTDGLPGAKGSKGDKGDQGVQGTQGLTGSKGDQGNMGMMGPPGPCSPAIQSAFSAAINQSFPLPNWPVAFSQVISNQQGHFNPSLGMYTAPVNGTYSFSFSLAVANKPLKAGLFLNFMPIVKVTETSNLATVSQSIVLHLAMGDRVWMQVKDVTTNGMYMDTESTSSFTGYLLHPDSCELPMSREFGPPPTLPSRPFDWV